MNASPAAEPRIGPGIHTQNAAAGFWAAAFMRPLLQNLALILACLFIMLLQVLGLQLSCAPCCRTSP